MKSLQIATLSDSLPVTLDEAKAHLRVLHDDDDAGITAMIAAGVDEFERSTGRGFRQITGTMYLNQFPDGDDPIVLPRPPLSAVSAISYTDSSGSAGTVTGFSVDTSNIPGLVSPALGTSWPVSSGRSRSVAVTFTGGDHTTMPRVLKHCLLIWIDLEYHGARDNFAISSERARKRITAQLANHKLRHSGLHGLTLI